MACVDDLPEEILEYILCLISPYNDLRNCRQVCQRWYTCCQGVVEKRKSRFFSALRAGCVEWFSPVYPSHIIPISRRYSHSACVHESSMYVFGGCTSTNTTFNDLWRFDLGLHEWTRLLTTGTYPSPKAYASMVTWNNCLVLFGGWTHPSLYPLHQQWVLFSELHVYDILGNRWTQLYYPGSPPPTAGHSASVHGSVMVVFGGLQKQEGTSASTNDVFCLDLVRQCWFKPVVSDPMPKPRYGHSQIKLNEKHILILAGCGGSNKLYNDIWLLTLPDNIYDPSAKWQWEQISLEESEFMPSQMWYNPACKVGNSIVVLSTCGSNSNSAGGNMSQLLVPGSVRRQPANVWVPPAQQPEVQPHEHPPPDRHQLEPNVNGQRGFLRPGLRAVDQAESSSDESDDINPQGAPGGPGVPGRGRPRPSIRPNASSDRERRLQVLSRMKERLRELSRHQQGEQSAAAPVKPAPARSTVIPHMLDIGHVITTKRAKWWPVNQGGILSTSSGTPPQPSLLYSLVLGRGHLVMFGGIPHDPTGGQGQETVSNSVIFVSAPSSSFITA
ncbi:F-box only protein 42-like [Penaeus monodon]|uniref:F-box only protein 42-like n=1 Tax=Penaeus monodon TaxID=6687 RepID=UPI0018A778EE|nr:F-box only protein 42-like [Penaeus monodon]